jgi:hypothetical protein
MISIYLVIPDECIDRPCSSTSTKESHETTISDEDVYQTQKEKPTGLTLQMSITSMIFYKSFRYFIVMLIHSVTL